MSFFKVAFRPSEHVFVAEGEQCMQNRKSLPESDANALQGHNNTHGVFVGINPVAPDSRFTKENITAIRNIVFESDKISIQRQVEIVRQLKIPLSAIVFSGNKSLHFWICLKDAITPFEYDCYVHRLQLLLQANGFEPDESITNENRLMRYPGASRNGREQKLCQLWDTVDNDDFVLKFLNVHCPPYTPKQTTSSGALKRRLDPIDHEVAIIHLNDKYPLLRGEKQANLFSWAIYLLANTDMDKEAIADALANNDLGSHRKTSEYSRAVDRAFEKLEVT